MPNRLNITQNAQFYAEVNVPSDMQIAEILNAAKANIVQGTTDAINLVREEWERNSNSIRLSIIVYQSKRPVYFMIDEELYDTVYAFVVIVEYLGYMALFKKSCADISSKLEEYYRQIDEASLTGFLDDDNAEFQKIGLREISISESALRKRSYEAKDLKGILPGLSNGRSIPHFIRVRKGPLLMSFNPASSRIFEASSRRNIEQILEWSCSMIDRIDNQSGSSSFLDSFAKRVSLDEVLAEACPTAILIESGSIFEKICSDEIELGYQSASGRLVKCSKRLYETIIQSIEKVFEINSDYSISCLDSTAKLRRNKKTLAISSRLLKKIKVKESGNSYTLQKYIILNGLYSITFSNPSYMYFLGNCFKDNSGASEIDELKKILIPCTGLVSVSSEKGDFSSTMTSFSASSVFAFVENTHSSDDYIFCDDQGDEWADHLTFNINESCISFIHSKYGDTSNSASKFHDVVGQALKNIGNMRFSEERLLEKNTRKFSEMYKNDGVSTHICRTRKGVSTQFENDLKVLLSDFKLHRKCILACSFISKSEVEVELSKIQRNESVPGYIIQMLWIISSFAHAVKDSGSIPQIYCKP